MMSQELHMLVLKYRLQICLLDYQKVMEDPDPGVDSS